jgi:hypothetical protein
MKKISLAILGLAFASSVTMAADCTAPEQPTVPNGGTSSMEQMIEGQTAVKTFQAANLAYMQCLEPKIKAAEATSKESDTEETKAAHATLSESYNEAVSKEEEVADGFNTAIRDYKAANPSPK